MPVERLGGDYVLDQIVTGDARQLCEGIPDESVDLCLTDPIYQNLADYEWLGQFAARVLRPAARRMQRRR